MNVLRFETKFKMNTSGWRLWNINELEGEL